MSQIVHTVEGLKCDCQDYEGNGSDCKHIQNELETIKSSGQGFRIMERHKFELCKFCNSGNLKKDGVRMNKKGDIQQYKCRDCKKRFVANYGFEQMRYGPTYITRSLQMYFTGMSVRDIADQLEQEGIDVSYRTVYNWVAKYSRMTSEYLNGIVPKVSDWFRFDEVFMNVKGEKCYLFASMDDDTRFWLGAEMADNKFQHNADSIFRETAVYAGKKPKIVISD